jgi:hypothetical protein
MAFFLEKTCPFKNILQSLCVYHNFQLPIIWIKFNFKVQLKLEMCHQMKSDNLKVLAFKDSRNS